MQLSVPVQELFDCSRFAVAAHLPLPNDPVWDWDPSRQRTYRVHAQTRSILFEWLSNDWFPGSVRPIATYDYAPEALSTATRACARAIADHFGGQIVKLMLAELRPGGVIPEHRDQGPALQFAHRCHVPLATNANVEFLIDGTAQSFREGYAYEIDNTRPHAVANRGPTGRIHLICDVMAWDVANRPS